jgi:hypothetical protein
MAAEELELARDHQSHVDRWQCIRAQQKANLDVPAARAKSRNGVAQRPAAAQRVDGDVRPAAGELAYAGRDLRLAGVDQMLGTQAARPLEGGGRHVDGDDPGPFRVGDHDRRQADATTAVDAHALVRRHPSDLQERPVGGGEATSERGRGDVVESVGERHQVDVGVVQRDQLGEGAGGREAGLGLIEAHLVLAI